MKYTGKGKDSLLSHYVFVQGTNKINSCSTMTHCDLHLVRPTVKWATKYRVSHSLPDWLAGGPLLRVATIRRTTDTFLFISHTTNVLLFKFSCNIFIVVRIIKEMPGSVASGTLYNEGFSGDRLQNKTDDFEVV